MSQSNYEVFANTYYTDPNYEFGNELMKLIEGQSILLPERMPSGILDVVVNYIFTNIEGGSLTIEPSRMGTIYHIKK